jgi:hypoxanthine phosphoribosyltransferase
MNLQLFADAERIEQVVSRLAGEIREAYADQPPPLLVAVLNGSVIFAADLVRRLPADYELAFVSVCSYDGENSTTKLRFRMDLEIPLEGRDVLILEDIVDTGLTLRALIEEFGRRGAASVKSAALILKQARLKTGRLPDFVGFSLDDGFVVGYGMDLNGRFRGLKDLMICKSPLENP